MNRGSISKLLWIFNMKKKMNLLVLTNDMLSCLLPQHYLGHNDRNMITNKKLPGKTLVKGYLITDIW